MKNEPELENSISSNLNLKNKKMGTRNRVSSIITVIIRRIIAVLKPSKKINDYINNARAVYQSMVSNPYFPSSALSITMTQYNADVTALATAEVNFTTVPPTASKAQRDTAKRQVAKDLRLLISDVQKVADANPTKAEDIITGAGFAIKGNSSHDKFVGAKNTKVSGTVTLHAPEAGPHEWAQLADDGVTWVTLRATKGGKKTIEGLTSSKKYTFKSAPVVSDKEVDSEWTVFAALLVV